MVFLLAFANSVHANNPIETVTHRVLSGDTLWDIANEHTAPGDDVRKTVRAIKQINELDGGMIHPGQHLFVPTGGD
jgi:LysM repeat protein